MESAKIEEARLHMDVVLKLLREERLSRGNAENSGARELAMAISYMEIGCMLIIRSLFADKPYSPLLKLKPVEENNATISQ